MQTKQTIKHPEKPRSAKRKSKEQPQNTHTEAVQRRAWSQAPGASPALLSSLQQSIGNQSVIRLMQQRGQTRTLGEPALQKQDGPETETPAHRTLRKGSKGPEVGELQQKLNDHGIEPPLTIDEDFGTKTRINVRVFQQRNTDASGEPLKVDGVVGPRTWEALDASPSAPVKPQKKVSSKVMGRIDKAKEAIKHTKSVFAYGAGNQSEALRASNFNSYYRLVVLRDDKYWKMTDEIKPIAAANRDALNAAKADLVHGGNCGEHAMVAFDYLRVNDQGETINRADVTGLDHAFILMGDLATESDADIAVADPWPTQATATTWEDHFAYTADRSQVNVRNSMVADGQNIKAVILAGLTLTAAGKQLAQTKLSDAETERRIAQGVADHWVWNQPGTAAEGKDYEYSA